MIIENDILSLKDVAELCGTSKSNISNWRKRDVKFPLPFKETAAGPIWKAEDIVTYMNNKSNNAYDTITSGNLSSKRIALLGRARVGKSFIISRFVYDRKNYVAVFCGSNMDKTVCPIHVRITEHVTIECFIYHSNFNSIYNGEKENDEELKKLNKRVSALLDHLYLMDNIGAMKEIENVTKMIQEVENKYPNRRKSDTYIDTYQKPSEFCKELLRECKLGTIEFIDTQGVSGNVEVSKIAKSDIYIFVLRPDNSEEAQTLKKIVTAIKPDVATSKVIFLYKKEGIYSSKEEYQEARTEVHNDMDKYSSLFDELKGNIISTDVELLEPAKHCIAFPTMNKVKSSFQEEFFLEELKEKMLKSFKENSDEEREKQFEIVIKEYPQEAIELVLSIMNDIPKHNLGAGKEFKIEQVILENHDRVMTKDNYRLRNDLNYAYQLEIKLLDEYFSHFKVEQYPNEWQQIIIKYLYRKLTNSVRTDRGLGIGTHPWEECPARTMLIEESLFADKILSNISNKDSWLRNEPYRNALKNSNVYSATWNYVGCRDDDESEIKLQIVKKCLMKIKVSSRQEMVLCRYVGGLRKVAEYMVLMKLGFSKEESINKLCDLPF